MRSRAVSSFSGRISGAGRAGFGTFKAAKVPHGTRFKREKRAANQAKNTRDLDTRGRAVGTRTERSEI